MSTWVDSISLGDGIGELGQFISVEGSHFRLSYYEALTSSSKCNFRLQGASLVWFHALVGMHYTVSGLCNPYGSFGTTVGGCMRLLGVTDEQILVFDARLGSFVQ